MLFFCGQLLMLESNLLLVFPLFVVNPVVQSLVWIELLFPLFLIDLVQLEKELNFQLTVVIAHDLQL